MNMNVGMLWLDDDKQRSFEEKVQRAADYYQSKYGRSPEVCLVNSNMLTTEKTVGQIEIHPVKTVLLHHFWLGMKV
jgi:hypothetical protein